MNRVSTVFTSGLLILLVVSSCQKEISADYLTPPETNLLGGTWAFANVSGSSSSTVRIVDPGSDVQTNTLAEYISQNNKGTYHFGDSVVTATGIAYDFNTTAHSYTYENGNLADSTDFPFNFSLPATSGSTSYQLIGADSMTTSAALIPQAAGAPTNTPTDPQGYRYTITGDTLTIRAEVNQNTYDTSLGVPITSVTRVVVVSKMTRQ